MSRIPSSGEAKSKKRWSPGFTATQLQRAPPRGLRKWPPGAGHSAPPGDLSWTVKPRLRGQFQAAQVVTDLSVPSWKDQQSARIKDPKFTHKNGCFLDFRLFDLLDFVGWILFMAKHFIGLPSLATTINCWIQRSKNHPTIPLQGINCWICLFDFYWIPITHGAHINKGLDDQHGTRSPMGYLLD